MATRNRTPIYRKYRDALRNVRVPSPSSHSGPSTSSSYSGSGGGPVIELVNASLLRTDRSYAPLSTEDPGGSSTGAAVVGLPPAWVDVSEEIAADMQRARTKMSELVKAHAKALMPSFGDGKEDQHAIELLTYEITDVLKRSEKRLQKLSSSDPSEDSNVRKNVQRSLATDLQNLSMEFRKKQSSYLKHLQQQQEGQDGVDLEMNHNGIRHEIEEDDFRDVGFNDIQMSALKKSEALTREREREIVQVVESVNELAQIMKDLSVLVIDQGTIVDRIDYNVQNVASSVEEGYKQLEKAERTQRKGGMVMCATVLVILIFIMLVLLVLKTILF
ncbi:Syntaxin [Musa troglodytarum]|uniref:Syntaxin n=1 Tax=Musa troglodytarum TaxID=320322 RepID=A0A9E7IJH9_9LILI|nr:Syntaxin [Musa troglodytarum]